MLRLPRSRKFITVSAVTAFTLAGVSGVMYSIPAKTIPARERHPAADVPVLGYGTGTEWYKADGEQKKALIQALEQAIKAGYTHIDCAEMYQNEDAVGEGIKKSGVEREKLYIVSKAGQKSRRQGDLQVAARDSIAKLNVKYLDLYLIHSPFDCPVPLKETWTAMEDLVTKGLVRNIGVSNFQVEHLKEILKHAKIPPVVNQIEFHPQANQPELIQFCKDHNILVAAYTPLFSLNSKKSHGEKVVKEAEKIGKKYNKSAAQVLLRWNLQHGDIVITTTSNPKRLRENQDIFDFKLTPQEIAAIDKAGSEVPAREWWQQYFKDEKSKSSKL